MLPCSDLLAECVWDNDHASDTCQNLRCFLVDASGIIESASCCSCDFNVLRQIPE
jgi:hypothetical protein